MPRRGRITKRDVLPDPMYGSKLVTKLINNVMYDGKKGVAQKIVYDAFDIITEKTGENPLDAAMSKVLRAKNRIVSIAVGAGEYFIEGTEMDKVAQIVDYVQLMTYDMRNGFTKQAGHHASLGLSKGDTTNTSTRGIVEMFHDAGVPYEKMVAGAAFYSRRFDGVADVNHGLLQPSESVGYAGPTYGEIAEFKAAGGYTEYWDEDAEASYLFNGSTFISFESPEAIRRKCLYAKERGLMGVMYWEHGCDPSRVLLDTIHRTMGTER